MVSEASSKSFLSGSPNKKYSSANGAALTITSFSVGLAVVTSSVTAVGRGDEELLIIVGAKVIIGIDDVGAAVSRDGIGASDGICREGPNVGTTGPLLVGERLGCNVVVVGALAGCLVFGAFVSFCVFV